MLNDVINMLSQLGLMGTFQFVAVTVAAIFVYRYFTDRG
jgi:hypothetical protein